MVKQALKSSSQTTWICWAEFTLFLPIGLWDHELQIELFENPNMELISTFKILPSFPNVFTNLCLHQPLPIKDENIWDQESHKMTTKGQKLWLGIRKVCMEWVLSELSSWTYLSFCFLTFVQQGAALYQLHESTPTGLCSNGKQCMDHVKHCFTLFFPWKWEWDYGWGLGVGMEESQLILKESTRQGSICQNGIHRQLFLLESGKDGAGRILVSTIGFTQKQIPRQWLESK